MAISSAGIGSGIDINSLVTNLVSAESDPQTAIFDQKESLLQAKLSAMGIVKSALNDLQTAVVKLNDSDVFSNRKATSSSSSTFTATATNAAVLGSYSIEVSQLAEAHKLSSAGFTDSSTVIGTGTLSISVGSNSFNLTIDDSNKTVAGIRDAINDASNNTGVTASTINVDDGVGGTETRLVLSSNNVGSSNALTVTAVNGGEGDLQQLVYDPAPGSGVTNLVERNQALDSIILIDNQTVTTSSNTISNAIDGITLTLKEADAGNEHTLTTALDTAKISSTIDNFISAYNEYIGIVNGLTAKSEGTTGILLGDALVKGIERQVRTQLTQQVGSISSDYSSLASIGITTQKDGTLTVDSSELNNVISTDLDSLTSIFSASDGIASVVNTTIESYVKFNGTLDSKTEGLNNSIKDITEQRERLALSMDKLESRLLAKFIAMDALVSQLTATGGFLTDALKNIPAPNSIRRR